MVEMNSRKAAIIGCGFVGSASAFALMESHLFSEIVLIDADKNRAEGEALDISHGLPFSKPMQIYAGTYEDISDAAVVIVTAGAGQRPGETRLDLVKKNVAIFKSIIPEIAKYNKDGILLIVANPVDILTYVAKQAMIPQKYGRIINIASMYGLVGNKIAGSSPYHAAKGGVVNLTRALAAEWGKYGITVNAICPGYFYTPLTKETLDTPAFKAYADSVIPAERYGEEGELDTAAIFLACDNAAYVNGIMLPVDGGYTCV